MRVNIDHSEGGGGGGGVHVTASSPKVFKV